MCICIHSTVSVHTFVTVCFFVIFGMSQMSWIILWYTCSTVHIHHTKLDNDMNLSVYISITRKVRGKKCPSFKCLTVHTMNASIYYAIMITSPQWFSLDLHGNADLLFLLFLFFLFFFLFCFVFIYFLFCFVFFLFRPGCC